MTGSLSFLTLHTHTRIIPSLHTCTLYAPINASNLSSIVHRFVAEPGQQQQPEQHPDRLGIARRWRRRPGTSVQFALAGVQLRTAVLAPQLGRRPRQRRTRRHQQQRGQHRHRKWWWWRWRRHRRHQQWRSHPAAHREPTRADQVHRE